MDHLSWRTPASSPQRSSSMSTPLRKGILVAFEGIDGAGKTTQARLLHDALKEAGVGVTVSKEPTNGKWGSLIRESASNGRLSVDDELEYLTKDRKEHVAKLIEPSLRDGKVVILDRYFYSTIAYQGARGADKAVVQSTMLEFAPEPDLVFVLDLPPSLSISRISESRGETPNFFEDIENLKAVREVFNSLCEEDESGRMVRMDGTASIQHVRMQVLQHFSDGPLKDRRCGKSYGCDDLAYCGLRITDSCDWYSLRKSLFALSERPENTVALA